MDEPELLRIPSVSRTTADLLAVAARLDLPHTVLLAQRPDGDLVFLTTDLSTAEANFMLDRIKVILLGPAPEQVL